MFLIILCRDAYVINIHMNQVVTKIIHRREWYSYLWFYSLVLPYAFSIDSTLSSGSASTRCPSLPVIVRAAKRELIMASSVASITAINNGDIWSLCKTARSSKGSVEL